MERRINAKGAKVLFRNPEHKKPLPTPGKKSLKNYSKILK